MLVATDFSETGNLALKHAYSLVPPGGEVHLLHVSYAPASAATPAVASEIYVDHYEVAKAAENEAEIKLAALIPRMLSVSGVTTTKEVIVHADVATAVCEAAERFQADVICMGTKGHSRTHVALIGSTVQAVLARAQQPVFVVKPPHM